MKTIETYIVELLREHDCVVVPDFGGFVLNPQPARFAGAAHELRAPAKALSFNINLTLNDGLLCHYISQQENIPYSDACQAALTQAEAWKKELYGERSVILQELGKFNLTDDYKWLFEPQGRQYFDKNAFGLTTLQLIPVENTRLMPAHQGEQKPLARIWKWTAGAAAAVILLAAGAMGYQRYTQSHQNEMPQVAEHVQRQSGDSLERLLQESEQEVRSSGEMARLQYYVIGGSFTARDNAEKFAGDLQKKGYSAEVLGNETGYFRVAYLKDKDSTIADRHLQKIHQDENQSAWILKW